MLRSTGLAAILGGIFWVVAVILHSMAPTGCVGAECAIQPMRATTPLVAGIGATAALFIMIGMAGLVFVARRIGRHRRLADAGLIVAAVGFGILLLAVLLQAVFFDGDMPGMPFFVMPGFIGVIIGFALIAIFILRSAFLPPWLGVFLVAAAVLLIGANEQTAAVLFAVPFGVAVSTVGLFMWSAGERVLAHAHAPATLRT